MIGGTNGTTEVVLEEDPCALGWNKGWVNQLLLLNK